MVVAKKQFFRLSILVSVPWWSLRFFFLFPKLAIAVAMGCWKPVPEWLADVAKSLYRLLVTVANQLVFYFPSQKQSGWCIEKGMLCQIGLGHWHSREDGVGELLHLRNGCKYPTKRLIRRHWFGLAAGYGKWLFYYLHLHKPVVQKWSIKAGRALYKLC